MKNNIFKDEGYIECNSIVHKYKVNCNIKEQPLFKELHDVITKMTMAGYEIYIKIK